MLFYKHAYILVKHAAIEFSFFMSNVSIINVFYHIFVSEVIFKTRIIKTKHTGTTLLNLTLLPSCNYLRGFILFDNNASWHWTMTCRNWEFQWVLLISSCKDWIKSLQYFLCNCYVCMCVSINPFVYLKSQYYFTFLACFFCFHFFTFCFGTANTQNILFKDKYFALLYWTSQLYLSTNFIYLYVKYYQFFQCFVLYVLFASPFTSAWRYRGILAQRVVRLKIFHAVIGTSIV